MRHTATTQTKTFDPVPKENPHDLLTISEVARILRVDETTVRRWIIRGGLEAIALPQGPSGRRAYRIRRETLNQLLDQNSRRTIDERPQPNDTNS